MNLTKKAKEIIRTLEENNFYVECPCCGEQILEEHRKSWRTRELRMANLKSPGGWENQSQMRIKCSLVFVIGLFF